MQTLSVLQKDGRLQCGDSLPYNTRLSSAGLVYAFYGKQVLRRVLEKNGSPRVKNDTIDFYFDRIYRNFVEVCSLAPSFNPFARPGGRRGGQRNQTVRGPAEVHHARQSAVARGGVEPRVERQAVRSGRAVREGDGGRRGRLHAPSALHAQELGSFTSFLFLSFTSFFFQMPCRTMVEEAIMDREKVSTSFFLRVHSVCFQVHGSGKILVLKESCPWKQHFFMLEKDWAIQNELIYALYPANDEKTDWRVQAIPVSETSDFDNR